MRIPANRAQALKHIANQITELRDCTDSAEFMSIRDDITLQAICFDVSDIELIDLYTKAGLIDDEAKVSIGY